MPYTSRQEGSSMANVYEYDPQKRVTKIMYSKDYGMLITYTPTGFYNVYTLPPLNLVDPKNFFTEIDKNGRLTTYLGTPKDSFGSKMNYDNDGRLSEIKHYEKGILYYTASYKYINGNMEEITEISRNKKDISRIQYYLDKKNKGRISEFLMGVQLVNSPIGQFEFGDMMGKIAQNLPKKMIMPGGGIADFTYEFDKEGRVTKAIIQDPSNVNNKTVYVFTYECY
jgi:hypothetical protein